jgi:hypothetical protein
VGFKPSIPVFKRAKTVHALDHAATDQFIHKIIIIIITKIIIVIQLFYIISKFKSGCEVLISSVASSAAWEGFVDGLSFKGCGKLTHVSLGFGLVIDQSMFGNSSSAGASTIYHCSCCWTYSYCFLIHVCFILWKVVADLQLLVM